MVLHNSIIPFLRDLASAGELLGYTCVLDDGAVECLKWMGGYTMLIETGLYNVVSLSQFKAQLDSCDPFLNDWRLGNDDSEGAQPAKLLVLVNTYLWDVVDDLVTLVKTATGIQDKPWCKLHVVTSATESMHAHHPRGSLNYHGFGMHLQQRCAPVSMEVKVSFASMLVNNLTYDKHLTGVRSHQLECFTMSHPSCATFFPFTKARLAVEALRNETSLDKLAGEESIAQKVVALDQVDDMDAKTILSDEQKADIKLLGHSLATAMLEAGCDVADSTFGMGYTSLLVGNFLVSQFREDMERMPEGKSSKLKPASFVILDRTLDLVSLFTHQRDSCVLEHLYDIFPPGGSSEIGNSADISSSVRCVSHVGQPITVRWDRVLDALCHATLVLQDNQQFGILDLSRTPTSQLLRKIWTFVQETSNDLMGSDTVVESFGSHEEEILHRLEIITGRFSPQDLIERNLLADLQVAGISAYAIIHTSSTTDMMSDTERLHDRLAGNQDFSHLHQLSDVLTNPQGVASSHLSLKCTIQLIIRLYSLIGTDSQNMDDEKGFREALVGKIMTTPSRDELESTHLLPRATIDALVQLNGDRLSVDPKMVSKTEFEVGRIVQEFIERVKELSQMRKTLYDADLAEKGEPVIPTGPLVESGVYRPVVKTVLESLFVKQQVVPELRQVGASALQQVANVGMNLLKSGFGAFGFGAPTTRAAWNHDTLVVFVLGGFGAAEVEQVSQTLQGIADSGVLVPQKVVVGGTCIANRDNMTTALFQDLHVNLKRPVKTSFPETTMEESRPKGSKPTSPNFQDLF